jgi:hypothetical protein
MNVQTRPLTEKALMAMVKQLAVLAGWRVFHNFDARRSDPGFPDLVMIRGPRLLAVELKVGRGKPTVAQLAWLADFSRVPGASSHLWTPSDWPEIEAVLTREESR